MNSLTIIIPAYNEEKRIGKTLEEYCTHFKSSKILVVLNGCRDKTLDVVKNYSKKFSNLEYIEFKSSIGKGGAIIEGFKISQTDLIGFVDADGSTPTTAYQDLVNKINGFDGILASRWIRGAEIKKKQPLSRRLFSRLFNLLVRTIFIIPVSDTQCGAKLFTKTVIKNILSNLGTTKWAFDIDLLYQLKRRKYKIIEIPTTWRDSKESRLNLRRTIPEMFLAIIRLRLIYSQFRFIVKIYDYITSRI